LKKTGRQTPKELDTFEMLTVLNNRSKCTEPKSGGEEDMVGRESEIG